MYSSTSFSFFFFLLSWSHFPWHQIFVRHPESKPYLWPSDCTNSFEAFLSKSRASHSPLCARQHLALQKSLNLRSTLSRRPPRIALDARCRFSVAVPYLTIGAHIIAALFRSGSCAVSLSVLWQRHAHTAMVGRALFTWMGMEACRWFERCKHVLNRCLLHDVGDVIHPPEPSSTLWACEARRETMTKRKKKENSALALASVVWSKHH